MTFVSTCFSSVPSRIPPEPAWHNGYKWNLGSCIISPLFVLSSSVHVGRVEERLEWAHSMAFVLPQWQLHRDLYHSIQIRSTAEAGLQIRVCKQCWALSYRRGHVYEINTWLWKFCGTLVGPSLELEALHGLTVQAIKRERFCRQSGSGTSLH